MREIAQLHVPDDLQCMLQNLVNLMIALSAIIFHVIQDMDLWVYKAVLR